MALHASSISTAAVARAEAASCRCFLHSAKYAENAVISPPTTTPTIPHAAELTGPMLSISDFAVPDGTKEAATALRR